MALPPDVRKGSSLPHISRNTKALGWAARRKAAGSPHIQRAAATARHGDFSHVLAPWAKLWRSFGAEFFNGALGRDTS